MTIPAITDFRERADELLISQYRESPKFQMLYRMVCDELIRQNADWQDLLNYRMLDNAVGTQLDGLGEILNESRAGRGDDEYREDLEVVISINRAGGDPETIINVIKILADATIVQLIYRQPATLEIWNNSMLDFEYIRYLFIDDINETTLIIDDQNNNVNATILNATVEDFTIAVADDSKAVVFDANNEIIKLDSAITNSKTSISLWYYCDVLPTVSNWNVLFSNYAGIAGNQYYLSVRPTGALYIRQLNAGVQAYANYTAGGVISAGNIYHIVATFDDDNEKSKIYVDSVEQSLTIGVGSYTKLSDYGLQTFGNTIETDVNRYANGKIAGEIRIFDYILTQDEVDYLYAYTFDEKTIGYDYLLTTVQRITGAGINLIMCNQSTGNPLTFSEYFATGNVDDPEGEGFAELNYDDNGGNITELYNEV